MVSKLCILTGLCLPLGANCSLYAAEAAVQKRLLNELTKVGTAYAGKRFQVIEKAYVDILKSRKTTTWQKQVTDSGDEKRRKSFLGEYFAYSGDYERNAIKEFGGTPVVTRKHRLRILVFRPGKAGDDNEPLSDKLKSTTYVIVRSHVPFGNENPYGIFISQALRGYSTPQLKQLVETYRDEL